jgi:hypothetical protein
LKKGRKYLFYNQVFDSLIDTGSGWTLITKDGISGVVPTTYLQPIKTAVIDSNQTLDLDSEIHARFEGKAMYSFMKNNSEEMSLKSGQDVMILQNGLFLLM